MDDRRKQNSWNQTPVPPNALGLHSPGLGKSNDFDETVVSQMQLGSQGSFKSTELVGSLWADRYELLDVLGHGGMGTVYKARNRINGQIRAVKILHANLVNDSDALRRFQQEAKAAGRITHFNAIQVIDDGVGNDGSPYLVMEYAEGDSLADVIKKQGKLPILTGLRIFSQICQALDVAHNNGIVHRDIKPSNVLIIDTPEEHFFVKVVDFGIAKVLPRAEDGTVAVTATGAIIGSPPYMSPEQCLGAELDHRSDIYSLGCLMYEVVSGGPPLVGDSQMGTMYKQINEVAPPLTGLEEDLRLVQEMDRIISKAMDKDPARRYSSVKDLEIELDGALQRALKGLSFIATLQMQLRSVHQGLANRLGSSRKAVLLVVLVLSLAIVPFSYFVAPYVFMKLPKGKELEFALQQSPHWFAASYRARNAFNSTESNLIKQLSSPSASYVEQADAFKRLADMYFDNSSYDQAAVRYQQLASLATKRIQSKSVDPTEMPSLMHDSAYALCRYSRCLLHKGSYASAIAEANLGLKLVVYDTTGDTNYQIYFAQVIGVATVMLSGKSTALTNDYFDNFIAYVEGKGHASERSSEIAESYMAIGDCYLLTGQWQRAIAIYKTAKKYWAELVSPATYNRSTAVKPLDWKLKELSTEVWVAESNRFAHERVLGAFAGRGDFALYNEAVCEMRLGIAYRNLGDTTEASKTFESAVLHFENWGGERNQARIKALVVLSDLKWQLHDYFNAWLLRAQAVKALRDLRAHRISSIRSDAFS